MSRSASANNRFGTAPQNTGDVRRARTGLTPPNGSAAVVDIREWRLLEKMFNGQYAVQGLIARGGMGSVYLARDRVLERSVAIKVMLPEVSDSPERRERFRAEARVMARLAHPNIVPLHAVGETDGLLWFVMGYVPGESLAERLRRRGRLSPAEAIRILGDLADALDYAHRRGIVHRDLKPDNVLIDGESGRAMLTDFGVATIGSFAPRTGERGLAFGTPWYMSPEQVAGDHEVDGRSDVYALGVLAYLMLSGRLPFEGATYEEIAAQHLTREPAPLDALLLRLPESLVQAVMRCLAKDPAQRWTDARAFRETVLALGAHPSHPDEAPERLRWFDGALAQLFLALVALAPYAAWLNRLTPHPISALRLVAGLAAAALVLPPVAFVAARVLLRCHGLRTGELWDLGVRQPGWWLTWWPRALRRPDSMWERLPRAVQAGRSAVFAGLGVLLVAAPGALLSMLVPLHGARSLAAFAAVQSLTLPLVAAAYAATVAWGRRRGLRWSETNDLFLRNIPARHPAWRQGHIAALLRSEPPREFYI